MSYLLHPEKFRLEEVLQSPLYVVDTARLEDVLRQNAEGEGAFRFRGDEHGGLEGIITLEDLLEEIVGDILTSTMKRSMNKSWPWVITSYSLAVDWRCATLIPLKLSLPESEGYTTIAGFLIDRGGPRS